MIADVVLVGNARIPHTRDQVRALLLASDDEEFADMTLDIIDARSDDGLVAIAIDRSDLATVVCIQSVRPAGEA